jgi:diguanylate cyclase
VSAPLDESSAAARLSATLTELRDVNEQLVLSAVRAQSEADVMRDTLAAMSHAAERDSLTALPNRTLLLDRFSSAAAMATRHGTRLAMLFIDLNRFKEINDTLGHAIGDDVLRETADLLVSSVRSADTVSRYGGDEFVILLTDLAHASDASATASKVIANLGAPRRVREHIVRLGCSIGISIFPNDGDEAYTLIARADAAMYRAKQRGFSDFVFHGQSLAVESSVSAETATRLQRLVTRTDQTVADREFRESELRDANEHLVLAVLSARALTADSQEARKRQTDFMGQLAHELRNPLAPMLNVAALMKGLHGNDPSMPKLQAIIERQVHYMSRLVDDLLDVSRATSGKLNLHVDQVDIVSVIAESVENCRSSMDLRLQTFTTQFPSHAAFVDGDRDRLRQVVCNLIDNASKYTPNEGRIDLSVVTDGLSLVMTVSDSGIGIASPSLPAIFELFVQDRHAVGFSGIGLGIGLAVVQELVIAHHGTIVARSAGVGQGSQFVVTLPLAAIARAGDSVG